MEYSFSLEIDRPLEEVVAKFQDPNGLQHWMDGFQKLEHLSGEPGQKGARSNFHFLHKGKEMVIEEEVLENKLPHSAKFAYFSKMGYNEVETVFEALSDNKVKLTSNNLFKLKGVMKIMGLLFKGAFVKQSKTYMNNLKRYIEN